MSVAVEPHGYASPVLEFCKQVFDPVALLVYGFTVYCGEFSLCSWRNTGGNATLNQGRTIGVAVVTFVAQKRAQPAGPVVMLRLLCDQIAAPRSTIVALGEFHRRKPRAA